MQRLRHILSILADGRFHSGTALASRLGLSRSAVWKQIRLLSEQYNIPVQAVQGRGYRLPAALELLEADRIIADLSPEARRRLGRLQIEWSLDSTNQWLLEAPDTPCGTVVVAEHQRQGRGRRGRAWVSPLGANLYFSLLGCFQGGPANLAGLSLAVAVSVVRALSAQGVQDLGLKWPNDILLQGKKLCGVLLELQGEAGGPCRVVCGVGLNVNMPPTAATDIDQPWTDLQHSLAQPISRQRLLTGLLDELLPAMARYEQEGLAPFLADWRRRDAVAGKPVQLLLPQRTVHGRAAGIDAQGNLLIERNGCQESYCSGEISLRTGTEPAYATAD
ncbi:bifunctional biotin--[acetyl-CoA-carboxylase] ligase/biotin operon repressor BirA [Thiohalophilus thiocyanatoxydans]|uniref:Bifunctional ligase/repressor BirA n=1 Tax=Thiohalophilus thiocyanatoxydans TaxID=381308 RepID=A0A4R8IK48_9GAMM|nr:bifunctional biotin--[acetyl-CoA-carboxylase] ligase/biotin operon repressor BirA [Thiohalophilus thiocyanatoxydans]TDY00444.1 BirA family biotin operon repressor/biotin-[acetyl-CoA-carboxylase] ligase [Thiohalophilus thiocyanatoxydans]